MKPKTSLFIAIAALIFFICMTVFVKQGIVEGFNETIYTMVERTIAPALTTAALWISNAGQWYVYLPIVAILIIIPGARLKIGLPVAISVSVSAIVNSVLKIIFAVPRPVVNQLVEVTGYGYPSGHVMNCVVFFGMCAYMFLRFSKRKQYKPACLIAVVGFVLLMGFSRVYLGVHTVTDALGGYLAGIVILSASICIMNFPRGKAEAEE